MGEKKHPETAFIPERFSLDHTKNRILNFHKKKAAELARVQTYILKYHDAFSTSTEDHIIFSKLEKRTIYFIDSLPPL